ncbi:MAG: RagB/SusD family nutrient uptake outer membrane protein [Marinilabiliaceae bacterium]|nr:RagB/SusD family nutrient uptake outer membrane protein [Marinilabiliaceae bacterium]
MNKILYLLLLVVFTFGCSDEDLTKIPGGTLNPENFWKSESDAVKAVNQIYSYIPDGPGSISKETGSDNLTGHHHLWDTKPWGYVSKNQLHASTEGVNGQYSLVDIRAMNYAIKNITEMPDDLFTKDNKNRFIAEIRCIRAWVYMQNTMLFGDFPLVTEVLELEDSYISRDSKDLVRKFVLDELEEVIKVLPESYDNRTFNEKGRVNKNTALALRARAALYFNNFKEAKKSAKAIIDQKKYHLHKINKLNDEQLTQLSMLDNFMNWDELPEGMTKETFGLGLWSYKSLWYEENATKSNPEIIFGKTFSLIPNNIMQTIPLMIAPRITVKGDYGWASYCPTQSLVNSYWNIDGQTKNNVKSFSKRAIDFKALKDLTDHPENTEKADGEATIYNKGLASSLAFFDEYRNRDIRFYASIAWPFAPQAELQANGKDNNACAEWDRGFNGRGITGYYMRKLWDPKCVKHPEKNTYGTWVGYFPVFRYAEILLTYAEAVVHEDGYNSEAINALNELRDRLQMPHVPEGLSKLEALNFIHNERRIELVGEGQRYFDIRRYELDNAGYDNAASKVMTGTHTDCNNKNAITWSWDDKLIYLPIPQVALDYNPQLKPNPGY